MLDMYLTMQIYQENKKRNLEGKKKRLLEEFCYLTFS